MPVPVVLAGPALAGAAAPGAAPAVGASAAAAAGAAALAAKQVAIRAAVFMGDVGTLSSLSSATLSAVLVHLAWKRLPDWIKEDVSLQNLRGGNSGGKGNKNQSKNRISIHSRGGSFNSTSNNIEEMEGLASVIEKIQFLIASGAEKLGEDDDSTSISGGSTWNINAALLAYIQLIAQLQTTQSSCFAKARNAAYLNSSSDMASKSDLGGLMEAFDQAMWAYYVEDQDTMDELIEKSGSDHVVIHNQIANRPGHVGHYVAISKQKKEVLIGVKGTSSLEDFFTDCCGRAVPYHDGMQDEDADAIRIEVRAKMQDEVIFSSVTNINTDSSINNEQEEEEINVEVTSGHERIFIHQGEDDDHAVSCHEGILVAACRCADFVQPIIENYVVQQNRHEQYKIKIVGHSLGAGAAALLALVLKSRFPELSSNNCISVFAFAPPPVLDHDAAIAAATSYNCVSVVNNSDIIPRSSLANIAVFLEMLKTISKRLEELNMEPGTGGLRSTTSFIKKLLQGTTGEPILSYHQLQHAINQAHDKIKLRDPHHLYIPGRVLLIHEPWNISNTSGEERQKDERKDDNSSFASNIFSNLSTSSWEMVSSDPLQCNVSDGTNPMLRFFEIDGYRMLSDHTSSSYYASIEALVSKLNSTTATNIDVVEPQKEDLTPQQPRSGRPTSNLSSTGNASRVTPEGLRNSTATADGVISEAISNPPQLSSPTSDSEFITNYVPAPENIDLQPILQSTSVCTTSEADNVPDILESTCVKPTPKSVNNSTLNANPIPPSISPTHESNSPPSGQNDPTTNELSASQTQESSFNEATRLSKTIIERPTRDSTNTTLTHKPVSKMSELGIPNQSSP